MFSDNQLTFHCKTAIIGSFVCEAIEGTLSSECLCIEVPNVQMTETVPLIFSKLDIGKVTCCFELGTNMILLNAVSSSGERIRNLLGMAHEQNELEPYFHPTCGFFKIQGNILLVLDEEEDRCKRLQKLIKEFTESYKVEILKCEHMDTFIEPYRTFGLLNTLKDRASVQPVQADRILLSYPPNIRGNISISTSDYKDLADKCYLNDVIIDFYLKYLMTEIATEHQKEKTYVFDSFFYKTLTTKTVHETNVLGEAQTKNKLSIEVKARYERVCNWAKNVRLFEKETIIIPINQNEHWFLAVICFPNLQLPVLFDGELTPVDLKLDKISNIKQPCILVFDSLGLNRHQVPANLRLYLTERYRIEHPSDSNYEFTSKNMPSHRVKAPEQPNSYDCGIFLLEYVHFLLIHPIESFRIPIQLNKNWDSLPSKVLVKREEIAMLIKELMKKYSPECLPLPEINLPSDNGAPVMKKRKLNSRNEVKQFIF